MNTDTLGVIPEPKRTLLFRIMGDLRSIPHVAALVLGGSYARRTARPDSDLDIGIYYRESNPFAIEDIRHVAQKFTTKADPVVTGLYEWGPWVNGGAWIETDACKVDLLYRNLDQVDSTVREAQTGRSRHDFDQQPPFGFRSVTYLGEIACCIPLYDPSNEIARLKRDVAVYPPALKRTIVNDSLLVRGIFAGICAKFRVLRRYIQYHRMPHTNRSLSCPCAVRIERCLFHQRQTRI